jgi:hypothetical protein
MLEICFFALRSDAAGAGAFRRGERGYEHLAHLAVGAGQLSALAVDVHAIDEVVFPGKLRRVNGVVMSMFAWMLCGPVSAEPHDETQAIATMFQQNERKRRSARFPAG